MKQTLGVALLSFIVSIHTAAQQGRAQAQQPPAQPQPQMPGMKMSEPQPQSTAQVLRLEDLEQMGLANNPTLRQADAEVRATQGRWRQAGLYPNPTVGYQGEQIRGGSFRGGEQGAFVQQDIVLGGKYARLTAPFGVSYLIGFSSSWFVRGLSGFNRMKVLGLPSTPLYFTICPLASLNGIPKHSPNLPS